MITKWWAATILFLALLPCVGIARATVIVDQQLTRVGGREDQAQNKTLLAGHGPLATPLREETEGPVSVSKTLIVFNEENNKKGEWIQIQNRSSSEQIWGIELPEQGLIFSRMIRIPEQVMVPREHWERFTVPKNTGISIVLVPEGDPVQLKKLAGAEIVIKVYHENQVLETRHIPIKLEGDLMAEQPSAPIKAEKGHK
jgi:hypothetical protein